MLTIILYGVGVALGAFAGYEIVLMVASLPWLWRRRRTEPFGQARTRFVVVIPAHNEGALIGETVRSILACNYPAAMRHVVVIADNCTDDTAAHARAAGAECRERHDLTLRGKPQALHWFFKQFDLGPFSGVAIVDADTIVHADFLRVMDRHLQRGEQAIQGFYGVMNPDETWLTRLAMLPAAVKFYLNFPGKQALGLSCPLAGNGMCFDAEILRRYGWNAFTLSEDWEYYLILTIEGCRVTSAPDAIIYGQVANSLRLGKAQRVRWMKGRIDALGLHWRQLVATAVRDRSLVPLDAIVDIARPTHSMLFSWSALYAMTSAALWWVGAASAGPAALAVAILAAQVVYFLSGFALERPPLRTWLALAVVPWYLLWKFGVTLSALVNLRERSWVKTTRN